MHNFIIYKLSFKFKQTFLQIICLGNLLAPLRSALTCLACDKFVPVLVLYCFLALVNTVVSSKLPGIRSKHRWWFSVFTHATLWQNTSVYTWNGWKETWPSSLRFSANSQEQCRSWCGTLSVHTSQKMSAVGLIYTWCLTLTRQGDCWEMCEWGCFQDWEALTRETPLITWHSQACL